jgi:hypothetical protein
MNYRVKIYRKGYVRQEVDVSAKSHLEAAKVAASEYILYSHVKVIGNVVKRYIVKNEKFILVKSVPKIFKAQEKYPLIITLFDNLPEITRYKTIQERDEVFKNQQEMLCKSTPVGSVNPEPEQTDTTALSGETSDSKSGLTSKKTSNGSAMSVICWDLPTRLNTVKRSGSASAKGLEKTEWKVGYKASHLKQKSTLFAKVVSMETGGFGQKAKEAYEGQVISVMRDGIYYKAHGYLWSDKNLSFSRIPLMITEDIKDESFTGEDGKPYNPKIGTWVKLPKMGDVLEMTYCPCGCGLYSSHGVYLPKSKLVPAYNHIAATVKNIKPGTQGKTGYIFTKDMRKYISQKMIFVIDTVYNNYHSQGWGFDKEWLDFGKEKNDGQTLEIRRKTDSETNRRRKGSNNRKDSWKFTGYIASYPFGGGKTSGITTNLGS